MLMRQLMNRIANPVMKTVLRSPLHRLVSARILLITVTGRKSGRRYTTPVEYQQQGSTVLILTSASYSWWKNVRGGGSVTLTLRGKTVTGSAVTTTDSEVVRQAFQRLYPRMTPAQLERLTPGCVAIQIQLQPVSV